MASIAVILLNYNSTRLTKKCIQSLWATKDPKDTYHILVWDNASKNPPSPQEFEKCELVVSPENLGFAEGNNRAVAHALRAGDGRDSTPLQGRLRLSKRNGIDYLLVLNNDTRVSKGMVRQLITTFESTKNAGVVLPKIYFEKGYEFHKAYKDDHLGKIIWYAGGVIDWKNLILTHFGVDEVDRGQFDIDPTPGPLRVLRKSKTLREKIEHFIFVDEPTMEPNRSKRSSSFDTAFATGCCFLTTPNIWNAVGGFPAKYFMYYEDVEFSMRLLKKNYRIIVESKAALYHLNAGSSGGSGSDLHVYYQTRNRLAFGLRYARLRTKLALLFEAKRMFFSGTESSKLAILHALGGKWGKLPENFVNRKH